MHSVSTHTGPKKYLLFGLQMNRFWPLESLLLQGHYLGVKVSSEKSAWTVNTPLIQMKKCINKRTLN